MTKICNNCGKRVDNAVKVCPDCQCATFRKANEITTPKGDLVHKIFYWPYAQGNMLSKTKLASVGVFLFFVLFWIEAGSSPVAIGIAAVLAAITYLVGFIAHKILGKPRAPRVQNNDYGLVTDLSHLLFFWQQRNGDYVISKTKCISFAVFAAMFIVGLFTFKTEIIFSSIIFALVFEIPVFIVGCVVHKITSLEKPKNEIPTKPKEEIPEPVRDDGIVDIIPEYVGYSKRLDELNLKFLQKDGQARELIEKRFEPPQLTYTRFITGVDKSKDLFNRTLDSARTMISLADNYSPRIAGEIETKITILESIIDKLTGLSNELILNENISDEGDVDGLIGEMDNLIDSVKSYEQ